jgi:uncharacterized protein YecE (DUF72 family)
MAKAFIGTSGWHYDHWKGRFYPAEVRTGGMLKFYAERFRTAEINNSFYRLPSREQFESWRKETPPSFLFAVKASRFITHMKKLKDPAPHLKLLFDRAAGLGRKLGPVVFQLPPGWKLNLDRFRAFLDALPPGHRYAFELRNPSWFTNEVTRALARRGAAFCIYQLAGRTSPMEVTARFVYVRLHGPAGAYQGDYSDKELEGWARTARRWMRDGKDVYVYFDNDQNAYAARNAARFERMLAGS